MARKKREAAEVGIDLTPMIDVVFQLIIFFILTMTISQQDLKSVQLPTAITALEEDKDEILILHLYNNLQDPKDPTAIPDPKGWHITIPKDDREFREVGELAQPISDKARQYDIRHPPTKEGISDMEILVRGDMRAPSHYFAVILGACQKAKVYKVKISIKPRRDQQ